MNGKVLIVDDSAMARRNLRQILETGRLRRGRGERRVERTRAVFDRRSRTSCCSISSCGGCTASTSCKKLRELDADARIVVVSADIQSVIARPGLRGRGQGFHQQAVRQDQILGAVERRPR